MFFIFEFQYQFLKNLFEIQIGEEEEGGEEEEEEKEEKEEEIIGKIKEDFS
ncbi:predicted protein [Uncinocarpus reesii 1704]|uniref:Uncharacterized protein n=1 Tax=Uncinocarpus reesii (strain UAMH 1704) TaxID=336963 RepID=C4JWR2_UNCRE|nr:uncharacterized protein UREG_07004 [Uncinocarpus reesii 1704]EEP82139.1 predicted protein [Uncinocarpus reesii 1704]